MDVHPIQSRMRKSIIVCSFANNFREYRHHSNAGKGWMPFLRVLGSFNFVPQNQFKLILLFSVLCFGTPHHARLGKHLERCQSNQHTEAQTALQHAINIGDVWRSLVCAYPPVYQTMDLSSFVSYLQLSLALPQILRESNIWCRAYPVEEFLWADIAVVAFVIVVDATLNTMPSIPACV